MIQIKGDIGRENKHIILRIHIFNTVVIPIVAKTRLLFQLPVLLLLGKDYIYFKRNVKRVFIESVNLRHKVALLPTLYLFHYKIRIY